MYISDHIAHIRQPGTKWELYTNRSYRVQIQKADPEREYNVPGQKGIVYNYLEDACEKVTAGGYIVTGAANEMWPISERALSKYALAPSEITFSPLPTETIETGTIYAAIRIPAEIEFSLEVDYGEKVILKGNRKGIPHGNGDYVLTIARFDGTAYVPDFSSIRIVNGAIFGQLYQEWKE